VSSSDGGSRTDSRTEVLRRVRQALGGTSDGGAPGEGPARGYLTVHAQRTPQERVDLLAAHLTDYRATVHRTDAAGLPAAVARLLAERGARSAVVPRGAPREWLAGLADVELLDDAVPLTARRLDGVDSVVTGCAVAIAETGTIVLDAGPDQGRRLLTLIPDHHVCVVRAPEQVVDSVPQALPRLDPVRPLTWISGPSATSDIELTRVEGVHGPRVLDVLLVSP
jgi:L-lactate dehydrogenase complex protein LldG